MTVIATSDFEAMRHAMVASQLRPSAVSDARVVAAMAAIPRERFVPVEQRALAYLDNGLPLGGARTLNLPVATGRLLTEATIGPGDRVLLIGAATGYAAAVAAQLAAHIVAVESDAALAEAARAALVGHDTVTLVVGPLAAGAPDDGPYDVLLIDGAVELLPDALVAQVRPGGRIATGLVERGVTRLATGSRTAGGFAVQAFADMACARLPGFAPAPVFTF